MLSRIHLAVRRQMRTVTLHGVLLQNDVGVVRDVRIIRDLRLVTRLGASADGRCKLRQSTLPKCVAGD